MLAVKLHLVHKLLYQSFNGSFLCGFVLAFEHKLQVFVSSVTTNK